MSAPDTPTVDGATARRRPRKRITPWFALRVAVSLGALAFLLQKSGIGAIFHEVADASAGWLVLGFGFSVISVVITVRQWHRLVNASGLRRSYRRCFRLELAGDVFDAALPSAIGGDVVRALMVTEQPGERVPAAGSVLLRRLCNFPGMVVVMAVGLVSTLSLRYAGRVRPYASFALLGGALAISVAASPLLGWLARRRVLQRGLGRVLARLLAALHEFRGQRRELLLAALRGTAFWSVVVVSQWSYMRAVGIHVPFAYAAVVVPTATAISMLPISLGGYGLREGAFSAFLAVGGLATTAQAVAVGVCLTAQTLIFGLIGLPFYLTLKRGDRRLLADHDRSSARPTEGEPLTPAVVP